MQTLYTVTAFDADNWEMVEYVTIVADNEAGAVAAAAELAAMEGRNMVEFSAELFVVVQRRRELAKVRDYFSRCRDYWIRAGYAAGAATCCALWWDCAETWNRDKSWTPAKREFFRNWRAGYEPYTEIPAEDLVSTGAA